MATTREILERVYYSTDGYQWDNNDYWCSNRPFKHWKGIECDATDDNTILTISLTMNKLKGSRPRFILMLHCSRTDIIFAWDSDFAGIDRRTHESSIIGAFHELLQW